MIPKFSVQIYHQGSDVNLVLSVMMDNTTKGFSWCQLIILLHVNVVRTLMSVVKALQNVDQTHSV